MPKMSEPEGKATENGAVGISDAENIRIRRKKQRKTARWGFPMPEVPEPVFMEKPVEQCYEESNNKYKKV